MQFDVRTNSTIARHPERKRSFVREYNEPSKTNCALRRNWDLLWSFGSFLNIKKYFHPNKRIKVTLSQERYIKFLRRSQMYLKAHLVLLVTRCFTRKTSLPFRMTNELTLFRRTQALRRVDLEAFFYRKFTIKTPQ